MLLFTILAFVGAHALRSQIETEFPDAPTGPARDPRGREQAAAPETVDGEPVRSTTPAPR
jgi:hypothetical protein